MNMKSYRLISKLDCSKDSNKDIALKFDAGKVESKRYGAATLSGHLLLMNRHGEVPTLNVKQIEEKAHSWLNEIGLEEYQDVLFRKYNVPSLIAYTAPGANPEKLWLYFKLQVLGFIYDDDLLKLDHQHANDRIQLQKDTSRLVKSLVSIMESKGDSNLANVVASTNPIFKATCKVLSHICRICSEQMNEGEYTSFASVLLDHIRVSKWVQEYRGLPYSENDYLFLRGPTMGVGYAMYSICLASDIRVSNEIIIHPLFQRYYRNATLHIALCNDITSLKKEIADNEEENIVLVKCQKYSLQKSFYKTEKAINNLLIDLKKDEIKLNLYFPADHSLKNFIKTVKYAIDGFLYFFLHSERYGNMEFENYIVEYDNDYNTWLEKISKIGEKNMEEPVLRIKSNNGAIILSPLPSPSTSNAIQRFP